MAVALLVGSVWLVFDRKDKKPIITTTLVTSQTTQATSTTKSADPTKQVTIEVADFKYAKPAGWAEISSEILESNGSASGIGRPTEPVAAFFIKVSESIPKNNDELKNYVLSAPKYLPNFEFISSESLEVGSQAGQKFTYAFTDSAGKKVTQQTSVVVYKQSGKAFFLLFHSAATDYAKQIGDFNNILSSFKFK